ncbi:MAG: LysR family transcriptional regulator [Oscillospiraceae bacterium]|nr:LysR family transcriptional regulator [Oscillospiraceae bacterium]
METRQLKLFCAVAEEGSMSGAARKLHIAQPQISRQIAQLEQELGVQLFRRGNKGILLTEAGESLCLQAQQLLSSIDQTALYVRSLGSGIRGNVRIGSLYSTVPYAMPYIKAYHEAYPQVELYIRLGSPQELISDLNKGELSAVFLRSSSHDSVGLHERVLGEDELKLIVTPQSDPMPGVDPIPIEKLENIPMCLLRSDDLWAYHEALIKECQRCGFSPRIVCQCFDTPMAIQLVQAGFGVSFLPASIVETHPNSEISAKAVKGLSVRSCAVLVWNENVYQPSSVERFTSFEPRPGQGRIG